MTTNFIRDRSSPFKGRLPMSSTSGFVTDVDPTIESHLAELNRLLGKRIFRHAPARPEAPLPGKPGGESSRTGGESSKSGGDSSKSGGDSSKSGGEYSWASGESSRKSVSRRDRDQTIVEPELRPLLQLPLSPKRVSDTPWKDGSLAAALHEAKEQPNFITLSDYIDMTSELSELKYAFQADLETNWFGLDDNTRAVLENHPGIGDYLIAFAYHIMDVEEISGLKNFILNNRAGSKNVANYAIVSAARTIIDKYKLNVPDFNGDNSAIVGVILSANLSLSKAAFESTLRARIDDHIFNAKFAKLIDGANVGFIPPEIKQLLIQKVKFSPIPIDAQNVNFYLPLFISELMGAQRVVDVTPADAEESDRDFNVNFLADDTAFVPVSRSAVKCAAQLYYSMVVGDELDVFNTVNYFTHKFLVRGGINIEDKRLREDLQQYVFSNCFTNLSTGQLVDRTRPAERQMFYRQVFNYGNVQTTDDVILNTEFPRLWKVLILESAKYLERTQASPNADFFVSRQNVMQAVEDLQYNLSSHCTGMANVITPLIYAESDFVLRRIFMHPEVIRQIVPAGGTWWRVVEALYMGMKNSRPKATVLYNKAKLGHNIIRSLADYNPATFEIDSVFFAFIKEVDRFITTQSILQESITDSLKAMDEEEEESSEYKPTTGYRPNGMVPEPAGLPAPNGQKSGEDGWDF